MSRTLRFSKQLAQGALFLDPLDFRNRLQITSRQTKKNAGPVQLYNTVGEIRSNGVIKVTTGVDDGPNMVYENYAIRTTISGSVENRTVMAQKLADHVDAILRARDDLLAGFPIGAGHKFYVETKVPTTPVEV